MIQLTEESGNYPKGVLRCLGDGAPPQFTAMGNMDALSRKKLALFCSVRCPGWLIVKTYDLARVLRDNGVTVIGGFQSPMEKECLELLLRGRQPVIVCLGRGLEHMRMPPAWKKAMAEKRLLLLSPFGNQIRRPTAELAVLRNELVAAIADGVLIVYADPGGATEALARMVMGWGKPVLTLDASENAVLIASGARIVTLKDLQAFL